jgi:hypothetical protein
MHIVLPGFDLAESIWSQDSDLTLDDVALESDSDSSQTRSSASAYWSAAPATPPITRPLRLHPPLEPASVPAPAPAPAFTPAPAPTPEPTPLLVDTPAPKPESNEPESPAPAYSRDPLEFDPALLASLDPQLRLSPFEAFEDLCWASLSDLPPIPRTRLPRQPSSLSQPQLPAPRTSLTSDSSHSDTSIATMIVPHDPASLLQPPAYPGSKPLPELPPPSPLPSMGQTQLDLSLSPHSHSPVVMAFEPFRPLGTTSFSPVSPDDTVQFFPVRAPSRARSKSVGGTRVRRLTSAIARLRGRE